MKYIKEKDPIYLKIKKNHNYVIFYSEWCHWSMEAVKLLKKNKVKCKGYIIDKIDGGLPFLLTRLGKNKKELKFSDNHRTRPLIFKDGIFIGGHDALVDHFKNINSKINKKDF